MLTPSLARSQSVLSGKVTRAPDAAEHPRAPGVCPVAGSVAHVSGCCVCHGQAHAGKLPAAINILQSSSSNDPLCEWGVWSCREAGTTTGITRRGSISQQESHPGSLISKNQLVNSLEHPVHICNTQQLMRHSCTYKITNSVLFV